MTKTLLLLVSLFSLSTLSLFGQSGLSGNLASNIYQQAIIYLRSGEQIQCDVLVYKKDILHHSNKVKYMLNGEKGKEKISKIDSIKLGTITYEKIFI